MQDEEVLVSGIFSSLLSDLLMVALLCHPFAHQPTWQSASHHAIPLNISAQGSHYQPLFTAQETQKSSAPVKELVTLAHDKHAHGNYAESELLLKQALEILEKNPSSDQSLLPSILNNLAESYREQGKYANAEPLYSRAIRVDEQRYGSDDPAVASALNNLGLLYKQEGRYAEAEPLHVRALTITTKAYGKDDLRVAITLNCLASLYVAQGRYSDAAPLARRSLEIRRNLLSPDHPDIGTALNNLALVYAAEGRYAEAQELAEQALRIDKKAWGDEAPVVAIDLVNLGGLSRRQKNDAAAEAYFLETLRIQEKSLGPDHPEVQSTAMVLARFYDSKNDYAKAAPYFKQAFANLNRQFQYHFTYMSEQDRLAFLDTVDQVFPIYLSFCFKYHDQDPTLRGVFYDVLLREKGLVVESIASLRGQIATSGDKEALQLLDQLAARRAEVARIMAASSQGSASSRSDADRFEREANQIERELVKRSGMVAERNRLATVTWRDVQKALGPNEAAVEYVRLPHEDSATQKTITQYLAMVVTPGTESWPEEILLGEAQELEYASLQDYWQLVDKQMSNAGSGLSFYRAFWKPLEAKLAGVKTVYVSPDGLLNEISFAALPSDDGRLLIEKYDVRTVLSTKDLLRKTQVNANRSAVLFGDPQFDLSVEQEVSVLTAQNSRVSASTAMRVNAHAPSAAGSRDPAQVTRAPDPDLRTLNRLPGTALEVKTVGDLLAASGWRVQSFIGQEALEETIKRVNGPRVLHIATHGYFDPDQKHSGGHVANPMLASGLFFAGANRVLSGSAPVNNFDDGILTAYEAASLNLQSTELVVLSACETGLGHSTNGEGVFGLPRALQEAGAQAVMMSMWKVPDTETQKLMTLFYQKWLSGKDKHEALREAQLELRKDIIQRWQQDRPHDWAAFVLVGP